MIPSIQVPHTTKPWNMVYTLAEEVDPDSWLLVGGLMVQAHARLAGVEFRPTSDADFMADILSDNMSASRIVHALERHGYRLRTGTLTGYSSRMVNDEGDKADVMSPDHLPHWTERKRLAEIHGENIFSTPGGAQACERCTKLELVDGDVKCVVRIPDQLGALILKAAAWIADHGPERSRHLQDAAILCALMDSPESQRLRLHSRNDFRRVRTIRDAMVTESHWLYMMPRGDVERACDTLDKLAGVTG